MAKDGGLMSDYGRITMWALDFTRAACERPWWAMALFRIALGRYAYREFIGLMDALERDSLCPYLGYELEGSNWHNDPVPFDWRKEREPIPLKRTM